MFLAIKVGMSPLPDAAKLIEVLSFVQAKVVPVTLLLKSAKVVLVLSHTVWSAGGVATGMGLTVSVNVFGSPVQVAVWGVTVMVATLGNVVVFSAVKAVIFPEPLATSPMVVLLFVQS